MADFAEPVLSACIVMYHPGMQLLQTVRCFQESDIELELHAVDNAPDGTLSIHMQWQCPGIWYYPQQRNLGYSGGHDLVLSCLYSRYHLLCHPDVTFDPYLLSRMVAFMDDNPGCIILSPKFVDPNGHELPVPRRLPTLKYLLGAWLRRLPGPFQRWYAEYTMAETDFRGPSSVEAADGSFLLIRTDALLQLRGLDPRYFYRHGDSDLSRRALDLGSIVYHPDMVVTHHQTVKSRNLPEICKRLGNSLRFLNQYGWNETK